MCGFRRRNKLDKRISSRPLWWTSCIQAHHSQDTQRWILLAYYIYKCAQFPHRMPTMSIFHRETKVSNISFATSCGGSTFSIMGIGFHRGIQG
jgi:hypothetical protein